MGPIVGEIPFVRTYRINPEGGNIQDSKVKCNFSLLLRRFTSLTQKSVLSPETLHFLDPFGSIAFHSGQTSGKKIGCELETKRIGTPGWLVKATIFNASWVLLCSWIHCAPTTWFVLKVGHVHMSSKSGFFHMSSKSCLRNQNISLASTITQDISQQKSPSSFNTATSTSLNNARNEPRKKNVVTFH